MPKKRKKSFQLPVYITYTVTILEKISVRLATWFALKLFFTPLKFPLPSREKPIRDVAIKHPMHTFRGSSFMLYEWNGQGSKVLLVHGWSGRGSQFFKVIENLKTKGFHVFAIDAPAHGYSRQKKTHMLEFVEALVEVQKKVGPFKFAIGHSLGGMAIFNTLPLNYSYQKIVVIGTPDNIPHVVQDFCDKVKASKKVAARIVRSIETRYSMNVYEASTDYLAGKFNPQGLIIHDENDQDISVKNAKELAKQWPKARLLITRGLGHRKVLMDQQVINSIVGFLQAD